MPLAICSSRARSRYCQPPALPISPSTHQCPWPSVRAGPGRGTARPPPSQSARVLTSAPGHLFEQGPVAVLPAPRPLISPSTHQCPWPSVRAGPGRGTARPPPISPSTHQCPWPSVRAGPGRGTARPPPALPISPSTHQCPWPSVRAGPGRGTASPPPSQSARVLTNAPGHLFEQGPVAVLPDPPPSQLARVLTSAPGHLFEQGPVAVLPDPRPPNQPEYSPVPLAICSSRARSRYCQPPALPISPSTHQCPWPSVRAGPGRGTARPPPSQSARVLTSAPGHLFEQGPVAVLPDPPPRPPNQPEYSPVPLAISSSRARSRYCPTPRPPNQPEYSPVPLAICSSRARSRYCQTPALPPNQPEYSPVPLAICSSRARSRYCQTPALPNQPEYSPVPLAICSSRARSRYCQTPALPISQSTHQCPWPSVRAGPGRGTARRAS